MSLSTGIPQLAILSHIDKACGETENNLRNVYRSKHLKRKVSFRKVYSKQQKSKH